MRNVEDIKSVIWSCKSVTDRQYNGQYICDSQNKKEKKDKHNLQNTTQKTKDWATQIPQKKPVQWMDK